jgi:hypothetical protein
MTNTDHFRKQAAICDHHAAAASDAEERSRFELLARRWREMAARLDASVDALGSDLVWAEPADTQHLTASGSVRS